MVARLAGLVGCAALALQPVAAAAVVEKRAPAPSPQVLSLPVHQKRNSPILYKRDPFSASIQNLILFGEYFVTASIGQPAQDVELVLDTGSSDLWCFSTQACSEVSCQGGSYDQSKSHTVKTVDSEGTFHIQYETAGSNVRGSYISETVTVNGVSVTNLTMAVATEAAHVFTGIMGVGLAVDESATQQNEPVYVNFPQALKNEGVIGSTAYSLYLDNLAEGTGAILFGGYDESKFQGDLTMLPLQLDSQSESITSFTVSFTALGISDKNGDIGLETDNFVFPAVLDSGTTLTYLPTPLYNALFEYFQIEVDQQSQINLIDCNFGKSNPGSLVYGFAGEGGPQIAVNFDEISIPIYDPKTGAQFQLQNGNPACQFGIGEAGNGLSILFGQTFLRSAYVLYDLDNTQVGVAQTVFDSTSSGVVEYDGSASSHDRISTYTGGPSVTYGDQATATAPGGGFFTSFSDFPGFGATSAVESGAVASTVSTTFSTLNEAYPSNDAIATSVGSTIAPGATDLVTLTTGTQAAPTPGTTTKGQTSSGSKTSTSSGSGSGSNAATTISSPPVYASAGALVVLIFTAMLIL